MARIVIVHGIANQFFSEDELLAAWLPSLRGGLKIANSAHVVDASDCCAPFYGHLFRAEVESVAVCGIDTVAPEPSDNRPVIAEEEALVGAVWRAAVASDPDVPAPEEYGTTLFRSPKFLERALNSLARSKYLADAIPLQFFGDLRQVVAYLNDEQLRSEIGAIVRARIDTHTRIVIGHSLGSVVAYEVLASLNHSAAFLSLGSPLGIRTVVFDKLRPPAHDGRGCWPGAVSAWTNVAAVGDIVAAQKALAPLFGPCVDDRLIDSGWDAHSSTRYLNSKQAGSAVAVALAR